MTVVVVGAGISGVACARVLTDAGVPVRLVDRGHRVGGRMASRRIEGRYVDLGASYLTASDPEFVAVVEDWRDRGLARPWTTRIATLGAEGRGPDKEGPQRWAAPGGLRSLVEDLATGLDITGATTVERVADLDATAVVLAMPDPQAARLLDPAHPVAADLDRPWEPVVALAAGWSQRTWGDLRAAFVTDPDVAFIADDGDRRGDGAPVLLVHATAERAARHLDDPEGAVAPLLAAATRLLELPEPTTPIWHHVHRWTFARPAGSREERYLLDDSAGLLGVCGDGWAEKPRVEAAYLSGRALGQELATRLS